MNSGNSSKHTIYQKEAKKYRKEANKETTALQKNSTTSPPPFRQPCYQQRINAKTTDTSVLRQTGSHQ
jgi:hypothetical protein